MGKMVRMVRTSKMVKKMKAISGKFPLFCILCIPANSVDFMQPLLNAMFDDILRI